MQELEQEQQQQVWRELRAAAESGWDFSSRWWSEQEGEGSLLDTRTSQVIPVDLNSFLARSASVISRLHHMNGDPGQAEVWESKARALREAIESLLWREEEGRWSDYWLDTGRSRAGFSASDLVPLWALGESLPPDRAARCLHYLRVQGVLSLLLGTFCFFSKTNHSF